MLEIFRELTVNFTVILRKNSNSLIHKWTKIAQTKFYQNFDKKFEIILL